VREDDCVDVGVTPFSLMDSLAPSASAADDDDAPDGVQDDSSDDSAPNQVQNGSSDGKDGVGTP
jgi:hypothetical protein